MHDLRVARNTLGAFLLFLTVPFAFNACSDTDNVSNPEPPAPPPPLVITTGTPLTGTFGTPFSRQLNAGGGTPPYTWSIDGTPPPPPAPGLTLNSAGLISGTPNAPGTFTLTYRVTDSTNQATPKDLTIAIGVAVSSVSGPGIASITAGIHTSPTIRLFALPNGTVNVTYPTIQLEATGGIPPYAWSVSPPLPNGLIINLLGPGIISGTPLNTSNGPATYTFVVTDSSVPIGQSSKLTRTLTVNTALTIDTGPPTGPSLPAGTVGQPYNVPLSASGATGPGTYTWSIVGNLTPASGLQPLSSSGIVSGTPTTPGSFTRTYHVQSEDGAVVTKVLTLNINAILRIDTDDITLPLPLGHEAQPYGPVAVTASGGTPPYTWSITPPLPASLTLNALTGEISGISDAGSVGTTTHMFTVQDSANQSIKKSIQLTVNP